ncbi:hypothetical protein Q3G72_034065 [Acer saccharum]|nr:hypothetical protein Q3G72_034065 [Acer saccharum]
MLKTPSPLETEDRVNNRKSPASQERVNQDRDQVITPWSQDFNAWYLNIIANAELADCEGPWSSGHTVTLFGRRFRYCPSVVCYENLAKN